MRREHGGLAARLLLVALVVASCGTPNGESASSDEQAAVPEAPVNGQPDDPEVLASYRVGMFSAPRTDNVWAYFDATDVWSGYILAGSACQLYQLTAPNFTVTPQLATHDWPVPEQVGSRWVVDVVVDTTQRWSDGTPVTAHDVAFTFDTVLDLELGGHWLTYYEPAAREAGSTVAVSALDDATVRVEFAEKPGLGTWPMAVALAPFMPRHHWEPIVASVDDASGLLATSGMGAPVCGPYTLEQFEPDAFIRMVANEHWPMAGTHYRHHGDGTVSVDNERRGLSGRFGPSTGHDVDEVVADYTTGPFAQEVVYSLYTNTSVAVAALLEGEISFLLTGLGLEAAAQDRILDADDVSAVVNAAYGLQFLGFNLEREPMDDRAFREAIATVIDREHITHTVMGGSAFPLYTRMPPGNAAWYDAQVGDQITQRWATFEHQGARVEAATAILADAGYSWDVNPVVDADSGEITTRGQGLRGPDGHLIRRLELLHPTTAYDPLRNTAGLFIAQFAGDIGVDVVSRPTEFSQLVSLVINREDLRYDMAVLGWGLGNPALPVYYDTFWRSTAGLNLTGYRSDEFDDAVARFMAADDLATAYDILWNEMEPILDRDLPYVPLFDTPKVEGYRPDDVRFPYTQVLGGIAEVWGMRDTVTAAQ